MVFKQKEIKHGKVFDYNMWAVQKKSAEKKIASKKLTIRTGYLLLIYHGIASIKWGRKIQKAWRKMLIQQRRRTHQLEDVWLCGWRKKYAKAESQYIQITWAFENSVATERFVEKEI